METTYTWVIDDLKAEAETGKVITIYFTVVGEKGEYVSRTFSSVSLNGEVSIPYQDLTSDICVEWVKNKLAKDHYDQLILKGEEEPASMDEIYTKVINKIEEDLDAQIAYQETPTYTEGLPW